MSKRSSPITELGSPHVDPSLSGNPAAMKYAQNVRARRPAPSLPMYNEPVAGGPSPPIPRLTDSFREGMTMADQAIAASAPPPQAPASGLYASPVGVPMHQTTAATTNILPADLLPEAATHDPAYQAGAGSLYASSQPALALKYGVIRNKNFIAPQQLQSGRSGLRPETIENIKQMQEFQQTVKRPDPAGERAQKEAASGPAGAAARLAGTTDDDNIAPVTEEQRRNIRKSLENMDDFDFNTFREMMVKDILNNDEQKKIIEERCAPMDITDIIMNNRIYQTVPILPGKFEPEFQSLSAQEDLALKRLIMIEGKSLNLSERYLLDKYSLMGVAAAVRSINKKPLPDHLDKDGHFNDELFLVKFNIVVRFPFHMLSSLGINFFWFDVRVRKLFQAETIKNG